MTAGARWTRWQLRTARPGLPHAEDVPPVLPGDGRLLSRHVETLLRLAGAVCLPLEVRLGGPPAP